MSKHCPICFCIVHGDGCAYYCPNHKSLFNHEIKWIAASAVFDSKTAKYGDQE